MFSARSALDFRPTPTPGTPLDRRGPPCTSISTKSQPRIPFIMPPFRGTQKLQQDCLQVARSWSARMPSDCEYTPEKTHIQCCCISRRRFLGYLSGLARDFRPGLLEFSAQPDHRGPPLDHRPAKHINFHVRSSPQTISWTVSRHQTNPTRLSSDTHILVGPDAHSQWGHDREKRLSSLKHFTATIPWALDGSLAGYFRPGLPWLSGRLRPRGHP